MRPRWNLERPSSDWAPGGKSAPDFRRKGCSKFEFRGQHTYLLTPLGWSTSSWLKNFSTGVHHV
jgi:hypothetical protein